MARQDWRQAYNAIDAVHDERRIDELVGAALKADEEVRLVATPINYHHPRNPSLITRGDLCMLVTNKRVLIGKKKLFGGVKESLSIPITDFRRYQVGLYLGGGPLYEVYEELNHGFIRFAFMTSDAADAVAEYINSGVAMARPIAPGTTHA